MENYFAVRLKDCIVVVHCNVEVLETKEVHKVLTYNLWTEEWRKYALPWCEKFPPAYRALAIAVEYDIYVLGGSYYEFILWKLTRRTDGSFESWKILESSENAKVPSPRDLYIGWEHGNKLWIFGGCGISPVNYLNEYGDFDQLIAHVPHGLNNQLFCYDPAIETWKNVKTFGDIPPPGVDIGGCAATMNDKVWLYTFNALCECNLYEFNIIASAWTRIDVFGNMAKPPEVYAASLTPITARQLVLHSYRSEASTKSTWILDVESYTWKQIPVPDVHCSQIHAATTGLNSVIILERSKASRVCNTPVYCLMLEPKSLQQLSMRTIHQNRLKLPWRTLPPCLVRKLECAE